MEQDDIQPKSSLPDLETLKGRLEQQEAAKIKAEQIVSTLSRIKAREKASRRRITSRDDSIISSPGERKPTTNNAVKEKSNLLKRKLEEDRAKVESQRGSESLNKVNEVVETLKAQLEDRDKLMQQLFLNAQQSVQTDADNNTSVVNEPIPSVPEIPDEIKQKIADLEAKIIDLQENLREKDNVISARTQAITLLSEDLSKKNKSTLDTLEETQEQMRQMQNNFINIEEKMKKEHQRLKEEAEDKKQRCLQAEKSLRIVEAARFDLSTRVAELQEKVVVLQTKNIELEKQFNESEAKQTEFKDALDTAKNTTVKLKAQFKIKMKALEEERDLLKKTNADGNAVTSLQERIAELEEEKGNLQLSLVDFDEQQEQFSILKERIVELEGRLSQQGDDLDSHVKAMSKLELEKLDLIQVVQERNNQLSEKDILIERLQNQLTEVEQLKVSSEMRAIELEEKLDAAIKNTINTNHENQNDIENLKQQLLLQEETIRELKTKLMTRQNEISQGGGDSVVITDLSSELEEWKRKYLDMETRYNEVNGFYSSLESRLEQAEKQNELIASDCDKFKSTVVQLQSTVNQFSSQGIKSESVRTESVPESSVHVTTEEKDMEINRLREELSSTTLELHRLSTALDKMNITGQQIDELNHLIVEKDKALTDVSNELEKRTRKLSEYKKFHKLKSEDVLRVSHELENVTLSSQERISELEQELVKASEKESELLKQIKELKEKENQGTVPVTDQTTQKMKKLAASLKIKAKTCKDLEEKLENLKKSLEEKQNLIEDLIAKENKNLQEISELKCQLSEVQSLSVTKSLELQHTPNLSNELEGLIKERDNLNSQVSEQQQIINQLQNDVMINREEKEEAFAQIEKIQENEFTKNEALFQMFERQVTESKTEIIHLQEQLSDVASKYEQAWAKLQEKDAYIESIESELSKAQERMRTIESSTNEARQNLQDKTELLGDRLKRAEEINAQFEKYKSDVEQRLSLSVENEKYLQNSLADKTAENEELKSIIKNLNYRIEQFEKECFDMRNYIGNLQNEIANLHDIQESHNRNIDEIERLNNEINKIKSAHEKLIAEFREKEKITLDSTEIELKNLSDKCTAIESDRQQLLREYENAQQQMLVLKEEIEKQKSDFEMRYTYLESERNHYEKLYAELKQEINNSEEKFSSLSEVKSKEVENIMNEQKLLLEKLHAEFHHKEQLFINRIKELEDYNLKLQGSLMTIESNAESLKHELNKVGVELSASNEELIALRQDQEKSSSLKNEIDNYGRQLEEERERVKILEMELLREKAKKEVENVVMEAESKVDSITQAKHSGSTPPPLFKFTDVNQEQLDVLNTFESLSVGDNQGFNIEEIRSRLNCTLAENERLTGIINEYERNKTTVEAEMANVIVRHENKDEEDGWGWGGDEVGMESDAVTIATISKDKPTTLQHSDSRILELEQRLHEVELENSRVTEELKNSQIRCSKLVKKAKELKAKSEGLERGTREKSLGFEDLDFAMQEELRGQIEKLEKSLQESMNENKNWKTEKEHLLRKVDTLTSGNERLIEMKERQDIELSIFEKQNSDLKQQVLGFEWKVEELMEDHERLTANCTEMEEKINSLATENEQLMKIVGDMKDLQKGNDHQTVSQEQTQSPMFTLFKDQTSETEHKVMYDSLLIKYEQLTNQKDEIVSINTSLMDKINSFNVRINELEIENYDLKNRIENYTASTEDSKENTELTEEIKKLQCNLQISEEKLKEYESKIDHLENENKTLLEQLKCLRNAEESLKIQMDNQIHLITDDMDKRYNDMLENFNRVNNELQEITKDRENLIQKLQKLENEKTNDVPKVVEVVNEPSSASVLFRGFGDDGSAADPFGLPVEGAVPREPSVSPTFAAWSNESKQQTKRESSVNINDLKKQITSLTALLNEKEQQLEMSKQLIDKDSLERQNLRDLQTEQNTINENQFDAYEDVLNAAELKYKDNLISKEEEIAHFMCELSSKDQQLINIKKEITNLMNHEKELNLLVEKYKVENDLQQKELIKFQEECIKLNGKINKLTDSENEYSSKVNYLESQLRSIEQQYLDCVEVLKEENQLKMNVEHEYSLCVQFIEERNRIILEKEREIEELKLKLDMVDDAQIFNERNKESSQADETNISGATIPNQPPVQTTMPTNDHSQTIPSDKSHDFNINAMDEHIVRFKEMIKQRDLEIDRLMEALGEAEERLIKMEEQRLGSDEVTRLQLKLDEALYTVHLRDIRCEELTLELMQLLEERDTLQLRLSTALRMSEELRRKVSVPAMASNLNNEQISTNDSGSCTTRTSDAEHNQSSSDQETTHSDTENCRLNEKLGELHNTGYQRDLSLHQDRIKRHNEQMHLFSSTNSPQSSAANANIEDHNASGGFFSWIFGSAGSPNSQVDV